MLDDLIIETKAIDTTNLSEQEKVVIDCFEKNTEMIKFDLTRNYIDFTDKDYSLINWWDLKNDMFRYNYSQIYVILRDKFGYNEQQINDLVKYVLLNHYKIKVTTTVAFVLMMQIGIVEPLQN